MLNEQTIRMTVGSPSTDELRIAALEAQVEQLSDALHLALPYVEDAADDPCFKRGVVNKAIKQIRDAIPRTRLFAKRFTIACGYEWKSERYVTSVTGAQWLAIYQRDEPDVEFVLADDTPKATFDAGIPRIAKG
jgi:hypothetical protein